MVELTNKVMKCRVKHTCIWCGEFIYPMQKAVYRSGVYEGNFFSDYWHEECFGNYDTVLGYDQCGVISKDELR